MNNTWMWVQAAFAAFGGFIGWYLGGIDSFLYALIIFVAVDYITGVIAAIHDRNLSSKIGARGIFKKVTVFLLVGIAHMVDLYVIGHDSVLRTMIIFFYLSNEGVSILENASYTGLPIPTRLRNVLAKLYDEKEQEKEQDIIDQLWERDELYSENIPDDDIIDWEGYDGPKD